MTLIWKSLGETKNHLNITNDIDWAGKFYQYINREFVLYFQYQQVLSLPRVLG